MVSQLGLGHLTRQIALRNQLQESMGNLEFIFVCSQSQQYWLKNAIIADPNSKIETIPLTPTMTMEQWDKIDKASTIDSYRRSWEFETQLRDDMEWGRILHNQDIVINDIECIHNPIIEKMGIPALNISNFSWSELLFDLGEPELASAYKEMENIVDKNLLLEFHSNQTTFSHPEFVGLLSRKIDHSKVDLMRSTIDGPVVTITYSRDNWKLNLDEIISPLIEDGCRVFLPERFNTTRTGVETIPNGETEFQNYIAASDLVIGKLGYGIASEVASTGTKILYWSRQRYFEDIVIAARLEELGLGIPMTRFDGSNLLSLVQDALDLKFKPLQNDTASISERVKEFL